MASVTVANAYVQIDPSFDGLARKLKTGLEGPVEKAGKEAGEKAGRAVGDGLEREAKKAGDKAGAAIGSGIEGKLRGGSGIARMAAAVGFGALINNAKNAASDLQQAIGATESVFGASASKIDDWAKGAADALGLSERSARESLNLIGSQFKNFGFSMDDAMSKGQDLVELGADLAATFGGSTADAVRALSAVFRGEFDSIEKYGVSLRQSEVAQRAVSMGLAKSTTQVSRHAQAQATMAMILEQTADAQGQFAREADTAAGAQARAAAKAENAAAAMGDALLPVYAKVTEVVGTVAEAFSKLPGPVQTGVVALAGIAALSGPLSGLSGIIGGIGKAAKGLSGLSTLSKVGLGLGAATAAVGIGVAVWQKLGEKQREVARYSSEVAAALPAAAREMWAEAEAAAGATGKLDGLAIAHDALGESVRRNTGNGEALNVALGTVKKNADELDEVLIDIAQNGSQRALEALAGEAGLAPQMAKLAAWTVAAGGSLEDMESTFPGMAEYLGISADAVGDLWNELGPLVAALHTLDTEASKLDLAVVGREALATAVATSTLTAEAEKLVSAAEKATGMSRNGPDAWGVWEKFNELLADLPAAQRAAIVGSSELGKKLGDAGDAATDLGGGLQKLEMREVASSFDRAADAASGFSSALDKVIGPSMDLEESSRRIRDNAADLAAAFAANGASLDINTEAGRKNREEVQKSAQGLLDHAELMIADGASIEEATAFVNWSTGALAAQAKQAGVSEAEMGDYLSTLGLTPDKVSTAIQLMNDEAAKKRVEALIAKLDSVPDPVRSEIQALIDAQQFAAAEAKLNTLSRTRTAHVAVQVTGGSRAASQLTFTAQARETGGPVVAGRPYIVGEKRPELFVPGQDGYIYPKVPASIPMSPNSGTAGGGLVWNQNAPVYGVDDLRATIAEAWRALQRKQLAGSRFA